MQHPPPDGGPNVHTALSHPGADSGADLVDGVAGTTLAATAVAVDVAVLRSALDSEHALLDVLA